MALVLPQRPCLLPIIGHRAGERFTTLLVNRGSLEVGRVLLMFGPHRSEILNLKFPLLHPNLIPLRDTFIPADALPF